MPGIPRFERLVRKYFAQLRRDGISPNEAAALAVRIAQRRIENEAVRAAEIAHGEGTDASASDSDSRDEQAALGVPAGPDIADVVQNVDAASTTNTANINPNADAVAAARHVAPIIDDPRVRICRICFGFPFEDGLGQVIRPCKCKGSMQYIHVECLNAWRRASANERSYYECHLCHYKYRIVRTKLALWLLLPETAAVLTAASILMCALLLGGILSCIPAVDLVGRLYAMGEWHPPWRVWRGAASVLAETHGKRVDAAETLSSELTAVDSLALHWAWLKACACGVLDMLALGAACLGFAGFALVARQQVVRHMGNDRGRHYLFVNGMWLASLQTRWCRVAVALGLAFAFREIFQTAKVQVKEKAQQWGETILEVQPDEDDVGAGGDEG